MAVESTERREGLPARRVETDVRLDRVTKNFDDVVAVDAISLEIEHGSFFALLGPSGCGKSAYDWKTVLTSRLYGGRPVTGSSPR